MSPQKIAQLEDRGVVRVTGPDAEKLLSGIITNDMALLARQAALYSGLLSPQGKILFEFFVVKAGDGFLLETARAMVPALIQRLTMYKLRADASIADATNQFAIYALWGPNAISSGETIGTVQFADPRRPDLGLRMLAEAEFAYDVASATTGFVATEDDYHAHRVALGVPEGGRDYPFGDTFPHEALYDQLNGVSFTKGCYVGQELVARMQHKTVVRKRVVPVVGASALPGSGTEIKAGDVAIGTLGSVAGNRGLANIRLDRAAEFLAKGVPLTAAEVRISCEIPMWANFKLPSQKPST